MGGELGEVGFEGDGRGVFHEDVVEEGGVLDGGQHGGGGCCYYIACGEKGLDIGLLKAIKEG